MIRTFELPDHDFDLEDPWSEIIASCAWALRSTVHTVLEATPGQIVFGRDMIFDTKFKEKWSTLREKKRAAITQNNERENSKRVRHTYKVNDMVLVSNDEIQRKLMPFRQGPYKVVRVYSNGTLKLQKGIYTQRVSIRRCTPYHT